MRRITTLNSIENRPNPEDARDLLLNNPEVQRQARAMMDQINNNPNHRRNQVENVNNNNNNNANNNNNNEAPEVEVEVQHEHNAGNDGIRVENNEAPENDLDAIRRALHDLQNDIRQQAILQENRIDFMQQINDRFHVLQQESIRLANEYAQFIMLNPIQGILTSAAILGGLYMMRRYLRLDRIFGLFRNNNMPEQALVLPPAPPLGVHVVLNPNDLNRLERNFHNLGILGGLSYAIRRLLFRR